MILANDGLRNDMTQIYKENSSDLRERKLNMGEHKVASHDPPFSLESYVGSCNSVDLPIQRAICFLIS